MSALSGSGAAWEPTVADYTGGRFGAHFPFLARLSVSRPYVPTSVRQPTPLSLVCRAGRRRELDQGLGAGRSGDDHGGHGAERRRAKRGAAERRVLHGRPRVVGRWEGCARSRGGSAAEAAAIQGGAHPA